MDTLKTIATLALFVGTLTLVLRRPRGSSPATWAVVGALAMLVFGLVTPARALGVVLASRDALLFLLALLLLAALVEASGFFEWTALHAARRARGDVRALFRNVFVLGALVTTGLSLDTTAVMLTPIVIAFVTRSRLPAAPFVIGTALVANVASLTLPVSNLTNLLLADAFEISFGHFARAMIGPQLVAAAATYALLRFRFRAELRASFDAESLPEPASAVGDVAYFRAVVVVLALVLAGYFVASAARAPAYLVAFAGAALLAIVGRARGRVDLGTLRGVSWGIFPLVLGLFVLVQGVDELGVLDVAADWIARTPPGSLARALVSSGITAGASNVMNNLPATLLARRILADAGADPSAIFGAVLGLDVGPLVLPTGSLATLLVLDTARKKGEPVSGAELAKIGALVTPVVLLLATLALALIGG